jgi:hypothetical protein
MKPRFDCATVAPGVSHAMGALDRDPPAGAAG